MLTDSLLAGTPILVPLTPSLYVPGKLASTDTVLVDIGTGFYVEKVCPSCLMLEACMGTMADDTSPDTTSSARFLQAKGRGVGEELAGFGEDCAGEAGESDGGGGW